MDTRNIIFFAYPYGGKDKHSNLLVDYFQKKLEAVLYINGGEMLRNLKNKDLKKRLKKIIETGSLIPDPIIESMIGNLLVNKSFKNKHLVFNGFPRNLEQARFLIKIMNFFDRKVDVVFIKITQKEVLSRMRKKDRDRFDDEITTLIKRFRIFRKKFRVLAPYLKSHCNFIEINGDSTPKNVFQSIINALKIEE